MGLQKHMILKRTKLLKQPNNFAIFLLQIVSRCSSNLAQFVTFRREKRISDAKDQILER